MSKECCFVSNFVLVTASHWVSYSFHRVKLSCKVVVMARLRLEERPKYLLGIKNRYHVTAHLRVNEYKPGR